MGLLDEIYTVHDYPRIARVAVSVRGTGCSPTMSVRASSDDTMLVPVTDIMRHQGDRGWPKAGRRTVAFVYLRLPSKHQRSNM